MTRIRYTMPARSQGKLYAQRAFVRNMDSDVETLVRKWLATRLDGFYCDLRVMHTPHFTGPTQARTHVVLNDAPPLHAMARTDEAVKAVIEATGLSPHTNMEGGTI